MCREVGTPCKCNQCRRSAIAGAKRKVQRSCGREAHSDMFHFSFFHTRSGEGGEGKIIIKRSAGFICSRTAIHTDPVGSYYNTRRWPGVNNELEPVVIHLSATVPGGTTPAVLEESLTLLLGDPTLVEPLERMGRKRQRLLLLLLLLLRIVQSTAQRPEPSRKRGRPMKGSAYLSRPLHSQARGRLGSNSGSSWGPSYLMGETW